MAKKINQAEVEKLMKGLDLTYEEAVELWQFDHEEVENEEVEELTKKADKVGKSVKADKVVKEKDSKSTGMVGVTQQKRKKKVDDIKQGIIKVVFGALQVSGIVQDVQIVKEEGQVSFKDKDGSYYSLKLTKHKTKPDGYKE